MKTTKERQNAGSQGNEPERPANELEDYAGGHIQSRHGTIDRWLLVVYAVLFVWALYYLYTYWGGLGPGLAN
jgi:hypothetical protein